MELKDTVVGMTSEDFKERFKAEYAQLTIRRNGLSNMLEKLHNGTLKFEPKTPASLFELQLRIMDDYITVLEARAAIEGIE